MNNKKSRTLVIGDIHGGYKSLIQCLERADVNLEQDKLIFLGDYVDGWSQTKELLDKLIEIKFITKGESNEAIFIRGNHDDWFLDFIKEGGKIPFAGWFNQGGEATLQSYNAHIQKTMTSAMVDVKIPSDHEQFLRELISYHVDDQNRVFVHGGYTSHRGIGYDHFESDYWWDRTLWESAFGFKMSYDKHGEGLQHHPKRLKAHKEIYIGHTTTMMYNISIPINAVNVWNLDTGGGFGGRLSIMDIDTKEYWQSDFVKDLYLEERGRL
jgi:serine/threonine protein phosphatase 1